MNKLDVITGLSDQDTRALTVIASLCSQGLMRKDEAAAIVQLARLENMERMCQTQEERKAFRGLIKRATARVIKAKKKRSKSRESKKGSDGRRAEVSAGGSNLPGSRPDDQRAQLATSAPA